MRDLSEHMAANPSNGLVVAWNPRRGFHRLAKTAIRESSV
jgi:hypothetical protein